MSTRQVSLAEIHKLQLDGIKEGNNQKVEQAARLLENICAANPDEWIPLFYLANCYLWRQRHGMAIPLLHRCKELMPTQHEIYNNLGTAYRGEHKVDKARAVLQKSLEINPKDADAYNNLGTLHINEGSPEKGIEYLEKAIECQPGHMHANWNLGLCYLEAEDWAKGFDRYAWGHVTKDRMSKDYNNAIWWQGQEYRDKTLVVYGEQGIGDEIMFASLLPEIQALGGKLIFDCHPRLIGMFQRAFPGITMYPTRKEYLSRSDWHKDHEIDYKISIGNAAKYFRRAEKDFPKEKYILPDEKRVSVYEQEIHDKIGYRQAIVLSWIGGVKKTRKDVRAIGLKEYIPLFQWAKENNIAIISGQYTENEDDVEAFTKETGYEFIQFPEVFCSTRSERYYIYKGDQEVKNGQGEHIWYKEKYAAKDFIKHNLGEDGRYEFKHEKAYDYDETLAFITAVYRDGGAVCSVNNSMVHLAGAAGIPCFTLTPCKPAWRYGLARKDMIWYPVHSVKQYRQRFLDKEKDICGPWSEPVNEMMGDIKEYFGC